jgi:hypothetical protein
MKKVTLLLLGLALSGAATLCAAEDNPLARKLFGGERKPQAASQTPAPAQRVAAAPEAKDACGKKKHKNQGKGWAKGHDKQRC